MTQTIQPAVKRAAPATAEARPTAIVIVNSQALIVAANTSACSIVGRTRQHLLSATLTDLGVSPSVVEQAHARVGRHTKHEGLTLLQHRDGRRIAVRFRVKAIAAGKTPLYVWTLDAWVPPRPGTRGARAGRKGAGASRDEHLTTRELEIARLIADGLGNNDIARRLHISVETVKSHVRRVLQKLGARSRAHAVALAWRKDLLE